MKPQKQVYFIKGCQIILDEPLRNFANYLGDGKNVIITDENVFRFYGNLLSGYPIITIGSGEREKTLNTAKKIYQEFLKLGLDRSSFVIGVGGGIVCDITGFAASTFMRGIRFGFVPTTLLAQADASIGGKNGVNLNGFKNIVGTFTQPEFVFMDLEVLKTLPKRERINGMSEIVKYSLIGSFPMFDFIEKNWRDLLLLKRETVRKIIIDSIRIKSRIVEIDEKEGGERRKLNFGHTFGHAIEKLYRIPHGKSVSIGMVLASRISVARGMLSENDASRIETLLHNLGLPTRIPKYVSKLMEVVKNDKKRKGDSIHFVLLEEIGKSKITEIPYKELEEYINDLC